MQQNPKNVLKPTGQFFCSMTITEMIKISNFQFCITIVNVASMISKLFCTVPYRIRYILSKRKPRKSCERRFKQSFYTLSQDIANLYWLVIQATSCGEGTLIVNSTINIMVAAPYLLLSSLLFCRYLKENNIQNLTENVFSALASLQYL